MEQSPLVNPLLHFNKKTSPKIVMITAYDMASGEAVAASGADIILVGDSLGVTVLGLENTHTVTLASMVHHLIAVRNGAPNSLIVCDMPKGTYGTPDGALSNARELIQNGADAVKVEGGVVDIVQFLVNNNIAVMGHLGLTPQKFDTYKVQGKTEEDSAEILNDAKKLQNVGAFSIVLELIPTSLGKRVTESLSIPTIGIGAGSNCDGQVLVFNDLLGIFDRFKPKFVRRYRELKKEMILGCTEFVNDVKNNSYPTNFESYN